MVESNSTAEHERKSEFVPLPIGHGKLLRVLGPKPDEAAVTVEPLVKLDESLSFIRSFIAGVCDRDGRLIQPAELILAVDPGSVVPDKQVPPGALLNTFGELPSLYANREVPPGFELLISALSEQAWMSPWLYCRKRQCIFEARSPRTGRCFQPIPAGQVTQSKGADGEDMPTELLCWDGASDGPVNNGSESESVNIYGGRGGSCSSGIIKSLDEMILDQKQVVESATESGLEDAQAVEELAQWHACVTCSERSRCYPREDGYAYAADRLVVLSGTCAPVVFTPHGPWRFDEACRVIGGMSPVECLKMRSSADNEYESWCAEQAELMETAGPARLLLGESDGRELLEVARIKLGVIESVLTQLEQAWRATGRPHLCWDEQTVRLAWHRPLSTPAMCWGFQPLLRKVGLQPGSPIETPDGRPLCYPPAFSDSAYLSPKAADAQRYFDQPRDATVFIKRSQSDGDEVIVDVLLEELNVPWNLFCISDAMHLAGDDWRAVVSPMRQRNQDDGEGLPFSGRATGTVVGLTRGEQFDRVECRWYPRFDEGVDLHAVGMLLFEGLLSHDERTVHSFREQMTTEIAELTETCMSLPIGQRDDHARNWVTERCEADAPAAVWTRRNLLQKRDDRNATRLDAFGAALWQEIMTYGLRLTTSIEGFSYCDDRGCVAPRIGEGLLLPLVELRGLLALLDDQIFGRSAPGAAVRETFK